MSPDCSRVLEALGAPLPADLEAHRATCADCQALLAGFDALGAPPPAPPPAAAVPPGLERARHRALEALAAQPLAPPWWHEALRLLGVSLGVLGAALAVSWHMGRLLNTSPPGVRLGLAVLVLLALGGGLVGALRPARRPGRLAVPVALGALGVGGALVLGGSGVTVHALVPGCLGCIGTSLLVSAVPAGVTLGALRRLAFQPVRALAAGLAAGAVGLVLVHLRCPEGGTAHLTLSHVGPWLLVGALVPWVRAYLPTRIHAP
ncbi:DUF1109 domain-containing protein [Melittangium boletus]|uniref:DUF1109 domain-containing protein n=1 Tax=Melittangium boletus TaxID=83453 RepID=UPI003DA3C2B6